MGLAEVGLAVDFFVGVLAPAVAVPDVAAAVTAAAWAASSEASWASALVMVATAAVTAASNGVLRRRASTCPGRTDWPALTATDAMVPEAAGERSRRPAPTTVPERSTMRCTVPVVAVAGGRTSWCHVRAPRRTRHCRGPELPPRPRRPTDASSRGGRPLLLTPAGAARASEAAGALRRHGRADGDRGGADRAGRPGAADAGDAATDLDRRRRRPSRSVVHAVAPVVVTLTDVGAADDEDAVGRAEAT